MRKNLFKIILPIFLFGVLCTTLYFTYGNKNKMERVRATDVTQCKKVKCTKPATEVFKCSANKETSGGRCICNTSDGEMYDANCQASEVRCQQACNALGDNSSYSYDGESTACNTCPQGGSVSGSKCYTDFVQSCPDRYTKETSTIRYKCDDKIQSDDTCEKEDSTCISPWIEESVIVTGCVSKPSSMDCDSEYDGVSKEFFNLPNTVRNGKTSGVNVGTYTGRLHPLKNVTSYYQWCDGCGEEDVNYTCTISPKSVNVTWNGNTPSVDTGVSKDTMSLSVEYFDSNNNSLGTTAPTAPGSYKIVASCSGVIGSSEPKCGNYSLKNTENSFEISSNKVNIPTCADIPYNGSEQTLFEAHTSGDYTNTVLKGTDAGEYEVELTLATGLEWNTDSGKNDPKKIKCKIGQRAITVKASDQTKVYDGTPLNADNTCEVISGSLLSGHTITCSCSGSQTEIGSSDKICESITFTGVNPDNYIATGQKGALTVTAKPATSVTLNKTGTQWLVRGRTMALTATVEPADSTDTVTWSSSDATIASVSSDGTVKGEKVGTATITATAGDKTASVIIKVYVPSSEIHVTGVTLNKTTEEVEVGRTVSLVATVTPDNATNKGVTWTTSDSTIATVSGGVVTGVKEGTATITVKTDDQGKTASATITVKAATTPVVNVTGVTLNPTSGTISTGETFVLEATVEPENASNKNVTWTSSNPLVATVSDSGVVTGISAGTATITVKTVDKNKTATATVTVEGQPITDGRISFESDTYSCEAGNSFNTTITYTGVLGGVRPTVTSSNNSIAEISIMTPKVCSGTSTTRCVELTTNEISECGASGENCASLFHKYTALVKCKATGTATLTASLSDGIIANASLTVNEQGSDYSITFDGNEGSLKYDGEMNDSLVIKGVGTTTIVDALGEVETIREGYTFDGWYTDPEDGIKVEETAEFGSLGVTTLYAHWTLISGTKFTLTYNANGGTACSPSSITVDAGEEWGTLCTPTRRGYHFNGWFTAKNGGAKVTGNDVATKNLTVYAQWIANPKTGISTPVIALLVVALVSIVAFLVIRKKKASSF